MSDYLEFAKMAALNAGAAILKRYDKFSVSKKLDNSPVTSADMAANEAIFKVLEKSGLPICSEEQILHDGQDVYWLVDPLDGTKEFIDKNGEFCVCIALIKDKRPVLGVIYIPITKELFWGYNDSAFRQVYDENFNVIINEMLGTKTNEKVVYTSNRSKNVLAYKIASKLGFSVYKSGSAIKFCRLAQNGGVYVRLSPSSLWDIAAGEALINAVKAQMINVQNLTILYSLDNLKSPFFICLSRDFIHLKDKILSLIKEHTLSK
ncbi:3'(2'),5'-bisphosphate nucleotidase CysQ family protein [Campylobacter majalis]|nr:3'(2'),5'-bisphosphate nucleotidase CysQ [Campylobacter majalis]